MKRARSIAALERMTRAFGLPSRLVERLRSDRRGGTAVQALLLTPIFLMVLVSLIIAWRTVSVRRTLNYATHNAVRYLALYPAERAAEWPEIARVIVKNTLLSNQFVDRVDTLDSPRGLNVDVTFAEDIACSKRFFVTVSIEQRIAPVDPFPTRMILSETREGEILCK